MSRLNRSSRARGKSIRRSGFLPAFALLGLAACGAEDATELADTISDLKSAAAVVEANDPAGDGSNVEAEADESAATSDSATCTAAGSAVSTASGALVGATPSFSGTAMPATAQVLASLPNQAGGATVIAVSATNEVLVSFRKIDVTTGKVTISNPNPNPSPSINPSPAPSPGLYAFRGRAVRVPDGSMLYIGGSVRRAIKSRVTDRIHRFQITGEHELLASKLNHARAGHAAFRIDDTHVLVVGGHDSTGLPIAEIEIIDTAALSTEENAGVEDTGLTLTKPRFGGRAIRIPEAAGTYGKKFLYIGGRNRKGARAIVDLIDPTAGSASVTVTAPKALGLNQARFGHEAVALADGRIVVIGGKAGKDFLDSIEILTPAEEKWTLQTYKLSKARAHFVAVRLKNGKIMVSGGRNAAGKVKTREIIDVDAGTVTASTAAPPTASSEATAVVDPNGVVVETGGYDDVAADTTSTETTTDTSSDTTESATTTETIDSALSAEASVEDSGTSDAAQICVYE